MNEVDVVTHLDNVNKVAGEFLKGTSEAEIAVMFDLSRRAVVSYIAEWKRMAANSDAVRARAREALAGADFHYNNLIAQAYNIIKDADEALADESLSVNQNLQHRASALKMVADLEAKRIAMLQQAGLLENQELADKLLEQERQQEAIMAIISDVIGACPVCKPRVLQKMSQMNGSVTIVEGQVG